MTASLRSFRSFRRPVLALLALIGGLLASVMPATAQINNPPRDSISIIVFPQRDFISASGYYSNELVMVRVIHDPLVFPGATGGTTDPANWIVPQGDPADALGAFSGIVEVNHPGGACWFGQTPDIRPGDRVQIEIMAGPRVGRIDETTVANITSKRPIRVINGLDTLLVVHGTAQDGFTAIPGNPLPIGQIEHRLIAPGSTFALNSRRGLRAVGAPATADGVLTYDPIDALNPAGINWTATYGGLSEADMTIALGAESRAVWLGLAVIPAVEGTIFEIGALTAPGPAAPCTAVFEILPPPPGSELIPPTDPSGLTASIDFSNTVTLNWTASTDNVGVTAYGIYRNGAAIFTVSNPDGSVDPPTTFVDRNTPPGTYTFTVKAFDEVGNGSNFSNTAGPVTAVAQVDPNTFPFNEPPVLPINIIAFPSRDFVSPSGYLASDQVSVQIIRRIGLVDIIVSSATGIIPDADGFAEVNHPGGACWEGVTPDMRVGDIVRTIAFNPANIGAGNPDGIRTIDQTHIAGVTAFRPVIVQLDDILTPNVNEGVVEIHGSALGANGLPLPIDQIEQRMIATRDRFDFNGRRAMRAGLGSDGTLSYDVVNNPMGVNYTSHFEGLNAEDVARMAGGTSLSSGRVFPGADTRMHWLGANPLTLAEATIFENSDLNPPGPAGPVCIRPLVDADVLAPTSPGFLTATQSGADSVTLNWTPSTDDWSVAGYRIFQDGISIANTGPLAASYLLTGVTAGAHDYDVRAFDTASPRGAGADILAQIAAGFGNLYGNVSAASNIAQVIQPDVTAPSVPLNLTVAAGDGTATLNWSASSDDVAVVSYDVYRDAVLIATVAAPATTYFDSPLATGSYVYAVDAADAAGNRSAQSAPVTVNVTFVGDIVPPSTPANVVASTTPDIHGRSIAISWSASTDDVGVTGYGVYRGGVKIADVNGATLSYTDLNLPGGTYQYNVDAIDSAPNRSGLSLGSTAVVANEPPASGHLLIAFPARDFVSASGFTVANGPYFFSLFRGGVEIKSDTISVLAADNPGAPTNGTGTVEVNHPGGTCWLGTTPNMRAGDVIRITDANGLPDQTTVANVTAGLPIAISTSSVVIHGVAKTAAGLPLPIGEVEHRLITDAGSGLFDLNGRRDLRAAPALDGTLDYDAPGSPNWTATYSGLTPADMLRICGGTDAAGRTYLGAESRGVWMGRLPLALLEMVLYETGPGVLGGPAGPICAAPAEAPAPGAAMSPAALAFGEAQFATPSQVGRITNNGTGLLTVSKIYIAGLNASDFAITAGGAPVTLNAGAHVDVSVNFTPLAIGLRQAWLAIDSDAANTTDLTVALSGLGRAAEAPTPPGTPAQGLVAGGNLTVIAGAGIADSRIPVLVSWAPSASGLVTSYHLQVSLNSAPWTDVVPQPGIATNITASLPMGTSTAVKRYQYRVRAMNLAVPSSWATGQGFGNKPLDQSNSSFISFGGTWGTETVAGTYGGNQRFASTSKDKSQLSKKDLFTIPGSIAWITAKGPNRGRASVSLDGAAAVTVDLYAPVQQLAAVAFTLNVGSGSQHQVVVQVLGTRNAASTGTRVDLDAFVLLNGVAGATPANAQEAEQEPAPASGPATLAFAPISPNPSVGEAMLSFSTPRDGHVHIGVMDVQGRLVRTITDGAMPAGSHRMAWDGRDSNGHQAGAGVYFAVVRFDDHSMVRRLVRMR
jgi:hypothetical protein